MKSAINKAAATLGRKGGKAGTGKAKARDPEKMRAAANKRWAAVKAKTVDQAIFRGVGAGSCLATAGAVHL